MTRVRILTLQETVPCSQNPNPYYVPSWGRARFPREFGVGMMGPVGLYCLEFCKRLFSKVSRSSCLGAEGLGFRGLGGLCHDEGFRAP